jgi:glycosyltransferase involved in cell wall biosynthesis
MMPAGLATSGIGADCLAAGRPDVPHLDRARLPNLLYVGDVPVESSYHGSALLYRLLQEYPADRLRVIEWMDQSAAERRLAGVEYRHVAVRVRRLLRTRLHRWAASLLTLAAPWQSARLSDECGGFRSDAVLTVAHGYSWMAAAAFARERRLPIHLIVHDDWPRAGRALGPARSWRLRQFAHCYRQAATRFCVSPYMAEEYQRCYGVYGTVLYPSRGADAAVFDAPPDRLRRTGGRLSVVFAGTINTAGYVRAIREMAAAMHHVHGRLLIYGPLDRHAARRAGLDQPNVELCGLVSSELLVRKCRDEADALFVPLSFAPEDRADMRLNFPSKLADYTAVGLPLLIMGPGDCSAVRWARDNPAVAEVVTDEGPAALVAALARLDQPGRRWELACSALRLGERFFGYRRAAEVFYGALSACRCSR